MKNNIIINAAYKNADWLRLSWERDLQSQRHDQTHKEERSKKKKVPKEERFEKHNVITLKVFFRIINSYQK